MNYVIGDVHGCLDDLLLLVQKINSRDEEAIIYFLGDFIDRGPKSYETLKWAMENISEDGKYRAILGNHEDMLLTWLTDYVRDGENKKPLNYGFDIELKQNGIESIDELEKIRKFLSSLELRKDLDIITKNGNTYHFVVVHAWAPEALSKTDRDSKKKRNIYLWERQNQGNEYTDDIIIHGHTPTISPEYSDSDVTAEGMAGYRHNAINLDGGPAFYKGHTNFPCMLCGICLETLEEIYPFTLEERFKQYEDEGLIESADDALNNYYNTRLHTRNYYKEELVKKLLY